MERDATGRRYFRKSGERAGGRVVHFFAPVAGFVTVVSATLGPGAVVSDLAVLGSRIDGHRAQDDGRYARGGRG